MKKFKKLSIISLLFLSLIGCQVTIPPAQSDSTASNGTNATTLTILDAKALKGSEKDLDIDHIKSNNWILIH